MYRAGTRTRLVAFEYEYEYRQRLSTSTKPIVWHRSWRNAVNGSTGIKFIRPLTRLGLKIQKPDSGSTHNAILSTRYALRSTRFALRA
jgi:hypothetical protein